MIFQLGLKVEHGDPSAVLPEDKKEVHDDSGHLSRRTQHVPLLDLNSLPCSEADNEQSSPNAAGLISKLFN